MTDKSTFSTAKPFVLGGMSGMMATTCIQPIDMVKVRIQLAAQGASSSPFTIVRNIVRNEGFATLYHGLSAALLRQATYTTARLGAFRTISDALKEDGKPLPFVKKAAAGLSAGAFGAFFGTPADLALIRMQADGTLPPELRRNYRSVGHTLSTIVREDGVLSMWKGTGPTVARAMGLNCGMLATYDQAKESLAAHVTPGSFANQFGASAIAGFFAAFMSLPFDFLKTQVQQGGTVQYSGSIDAATQILRSQGPLAFYKGFPTYYFRIAPHAMLTLLFLEQLTGGLDNLLNRPSRVQVAFAKEEKSTER